MITSFAHIPKKGRLGCSKNLSSLKDYCQSMRDNYVRDRICVLFLMKQLWIDKFTGASLSKKYFHYEYFLFLNHLSLVNFIVYIKTFFLKHVNSGKLKIF